MYWTKNYDIIGWLHNRLVWLRMQSLTIKTLVLTKNVMIYNWNQFLVLLSHIFATNTDLIVAKLLRIFIFVQK